jgi:hypothetical protein
MSARNYCIMTIDSPLMLREWGLSSRREGEGGKEQKPRGQRGRRRERCGQQSHDDSTGDDSVERERGQTWTHQI